MNELLKKYTEQLESFETMKDSLESQMEGNDNAMMLGNLYYMVLKDIVRDLSALANER